MIDGIKKLIEERKYISAEELIRASTRNALQAISSLNFDLELRMNGDQLVFAEVKRRLSAYLESVEELSAVLSIVAYHGGQELHHALRRALEQIGNDMYDLGRINKPGFELWAKLRRYPPLVIFHRVACAAIAGGRWGNLSPLIRLAKTIEHPGVQSRVPMITIMKPREIIAGLNDHWLVMEALDNQSKRHTPSEDHLADLVTSTLAEFGLDEEEAGWIFDGWIFLAQVAFLNLTERTERVTSYFSAGRWWRINSVYSRWEYTPQFDMIQRIQREGDACLLLSSGVAADAATFITLAEEARTIITKASSSHGY